MAKKITIFIVSLCIFLISAIPVYADYQVPFDRIAESKDISWSEDYHTVFATDELYYVVPNNWQSSFGDNDFGPAYYFNFSNGSLTVKASKNPVISTPAVYSVSRSNPYGEWTLLNDSNGYWAFSSGVNVGKAQILYSAIDLTNSDGQVVFQRSPLGQSQQGGVSSIGSILSNLPLKNVLNELIACLPVLFPVLITFIAIRKGITFCLMILKQA